MVKNIPSQLEWPTNKSIARFITTNSQPSKLHDTSREFLLGVIENYWKDKLEGSQNAINLLRSNFGSVNVFLKDMSTTVITERPVYETVNILSNIGGLLGLYLGFSVLTILEIVDFGFDLFEYLRIKGNQKKLQRRLTDPHKQRVKEKGESGGFSDSRPPSNATETNSGAEKPKVSGRHPIISAPDEGVFLPVLPANSSMIMSDCAEQHQAERFQTRLSSFFSL